MGISDSKPVYVTPGVKKPIVLQSESSPAAYIDPETGSSFDPETGSSFDPSYGSRPRPGIGSSSEPEAEDPNKPTPYPTTPSKQYSDFSKALGKGLSLQGLYGTNAGSIQGQLGKTPTIPMGMAKGNLRYMGVDDISDAPIYKFKKPPSSSSISNSKYDDTYVGSG